MTVKTDLNDLAEVIRDARKKAGLSQLELATMAGVGKTLVFNLEKGSTKITFENILKVLRVLNISIQYVPPFNENIK